MRPHKKLTDVEQSYYRLFCKKHQKWLLGMDNSYSAFYASHLPSLECFIDELLSDDEIPFVVCLDSYGQKSYHGSRLAYRYFARLPDYIKLAGLLSDHYEYSERINRFVHCCKELGLLGVSFDWKNTCDYYVKTDERFNGISNAELFNTLVAHIRNTWKMNHFQLKVNTRRHEANKQHIAYCRYVDGLFARYSSLLLVAFNLFYHKEADVSTLFRTHY